MDHVLFADRQYNSEATRDALHAQNMISVISRRGENHGGSLERTKGVFVRVIS